MTSGRPRRWSRSSSALPIALSYLTLVGLAGLLALAAKVVGVLPRDAAWWIAPSVVAIGTPLSALTSRWTSRRDVKHGVVECAVRPAGSDTATWQHGRVKDVAGELVFTSGGPAGMRFPRGRPEPFPIRCMSQDEGRRPALRQVWSISPALHIVRIAVGVKELELAALPDDLERLRRMRPVPEGD